MEPSATAFTLHFGCIQCCGGSHSLPHYIQLQSRRVRSLEFLPVAVLEVKSPPASHFVWLGDITSTAAMIGYLKVNQLKGCHTQTPWIAPLTKVAADNAETVCSRWWSLMLVVGSSARDASGLSVVTLSIMSSWVETLSTLLPFIPCLADSGMMAWDR